MRHFNHPEIPVYWGTDERLRFVQEANTACGLPCNVLFSGPGEWSDRLTRLLHQIPTDYILYTQEDHWPHRQPPDLARMMKIVQEYDLLRLQLAPINHYYTLRQQGNIHFFLPESKYLVSHQPSIWKKDFLLSCLEPGESPWVNEYEGTKRLNNHPDIENRIAIFPYDWYSHKCIKGKFQS